MAMPLDIRRDKINAIVLERSGNEVNRYYFSRLFLFVLLNPVERQKIPTTHLVVDF